MRSEKTFLKATWSARKGSPLYVYLVRALDAMSSKGAPDCGEGGRGERVFGSWLRDLFARVLVAGVLFIEGESAEFVLQWRWKGWRWLVGG